MRELAMVYSFEFLVYGKINSGWSQDEVGYETYKDSKLVESKTKIKYETCWK
jgi:hypothetical protein